MVSPGDAIHNVLDEVERFAGRKLQYRADIIVLMELAVSYQQRRMFDDVMFLAKFLKNAHHILQRIGPNDEGYPKLSAEFREALEKFTTLVKTIIKEGPEDVKQSFTARFFTLTQQSLTNLLQLAADVSWVKNYTIDTKRQIFSA